MQVPATELVTEKGSVPFADLDDLFRREVEPIISDGYVSAAHKETTRYLFIIGGKPYSAAVESPLGGKTTSIKEFFTFCKTVERVDLRAVKADKKILLCMLVRLGKRPAKEALSDAVNMEDLVRKIEEQAKDIIVVTESDEGLGFAIFIRGKAAFVHLPGAGETTIEKLLLYCYERGRQRPFKIKVYTNIKVVHAPDSEPFPDEGVATHYTKGTPDAWVELYDEGGEQIGKFPLVEELRIGRDPDNEIHLSDRMVSRHHAVIRYCEGRFVAEDLASTNGTFHNGSRITTLELGDGDELNIVGFRLRFRSPRRSAEESGTAEQAPDLASQTFYADGSEKKSLVPSAALYMNDGSVHPLGSITTIGKGEDSDIRVDGMLMAKRHAVIIRGKDRFTVLKKAVLAPVKVNGRKVTEHPLSDGDVIEVGPLKMTFKG
ncbi:MAG TPA: FHA domain-containing protein [Deltaproteobacteria bacterium]|nr:FHA domain-containing protein [Deltaproteobacteria bacterium]